MTERYPIAKKTALAGAGLALVALTGCGAEKAASPDSTTVQSSNSVAPQPTQAPETINPDSSEKISGKDTALICKGVARIALSGNQYRVVGNPAVDTTTNKHPLFIEDISSVGITLDTEGDSSKPIQWYDLGGQKVSPTDIPCVEQTIFVHDVMQPSNNRVKVVTTEAQAPKGIVHVNMLALHDHSETSLDHLAIHDFGVQGTVATQEMIEHLG